MSVPVILAALLGDYVSRLLNKKPLYGLLAERFLAPDVNKLVAPPTGESA